MHHLTAHINTNYDACSFIGSFGSITRLKGFLPDRASLLDFASSVSAHCTMG